MILCCGEALIDMIPEETASGRMAFVPHPGGAVYNTAIALGRLGQNVGLLTGLSRDMFGMQLQAGLVGSGVDDSLAIRTDRPTTLAFVEVIDGAAHYNFIDEMTAGRLLTPQDMPDLPDTVRALYFGGISLATEPCADAYASLLTASAEGRAVMLDPNIRADFIADNTRYRSRLSEMMKRTDILKVSDEDLAWIAPGQNPIRERAKALLRRGPSLVILTEGASGATAFLNDGTEVAVPARQTAVVDTVGAGDTFNAGVLASLSRAGVLTKGSLAQLSSETVRDALRFGSEVAAVTVSRAGANPPWERELDAEGRTA